MKYRIAIWASIGLLVAGFWAVFAFATFPSTDRMRHVWPLVAFTCPIALLGTHRAVSLYQALAANALTYAVVGLVVEALRRQLHHARSK
jgi:hypothetical protein